MTQTQKQARETAAKIADALISAADEADAMAKALRSRAREIRRPEPWATITPLAHAEWARSRASLDWGRVWSHLTIALTGGQS